MMGDMIDKEYRAIRLREESLLLGFVWLAIFAVLCAIAFCLVCVPVWCCSKFVWLFNKAEDHSRRILGLPAIPKTY
jgi:hypothetical protein